MMRQRLSLLLMVALATGVFGCMSAEERVQRHLDRAQVYDDSGELEKALVELQNALKLAPQSAETNLRTAALLKRQERWEDALFYYEEAYRLDSKLDDAALGIAYLLLFESTDRADQLVAEVLARTPDSSSAHQLRSDVMLIRNDLNGALAEALTSVELEPKSARAALQVGIVRKAFVAQQTRAGKQPEDALYAQADAEFAKAGELAGARGEFNWLVRSIGERAQLQTNRHGHGPHIMQLYVDGYEAVKVSPGDAARLIGSANGVARSAKDQELRFWALTHAVELRPDQLESWRELADLTAKRGGDGVAVMQRMVEQRPEDSRAHTAYAEYLSTAGRNEDGVAYLEKVLPDSNAPDSILAAVVTLNLLGRDFDAAAAALARLRAEHPESVQTDFAEATLANAEGRLSDAIAALERWTSRQETPAGFAKLADARMRSGNPRDALDAIDRAISLSAKPRADYRRLRGRILVLLGDYQAALQALIPRKKGGGVPLHFLPDVARAFYGLGRDVPAKQALERALQEEQPAPAALLLFGREEAQRDPAGARAALERGAKLYPTYTQFSEMLINADLRAGKTPEAMERARSLATLLPDDSRAQMTLARTLISVGQADEAVKQAELVKQRWPAQPGSAELYLEVMTRSGRGDEAFQSLTQQKAEGKLAPTARVVLARLHLARGEGQQAIELLRSALAEQPGLVGAQNDLAYNLARRGEDLENATELAQEARANRPDSTEIADTLGFVYLQRELAEAALVQFDAALELAEPESTSWATAQFHRGLALRTIGRESDAVAAFELALASGAEFPDAKEAHRLLADLSANAKAASPAEGS